MTPALVLAVLAAPNPAAQAVKTIDIDRFDTPPYSVTVTGENYNTHDWFGLTRSQCLFSHRSTHFTINNNPNSTALTLSLGSGHQKFTSPLQVSWHHLLNYVVDGAAFVDFSSVDLFMVDFQTIPGGKLPDIPRLSVTDSQFHSGSVGWHIRVGGIYFRRTEFPGGIDWRHIRSVAFQQDFSSLPNPTTYDVTRFYATLKPQSLPPSQ